VTKAERARIHDALERAEAGTTARIGVRFVPDVQVDALERAKTEFERAGMHGHAARNAALILVAPKARQFAVIGDRELHARVGDRFWNEAVELMRERFAADDIAGAVVVGLEHIGAALHEHFAQ